MFCTLCQMTYQGIHWCAGMSSRRHGTRTPDVPSWESIKAAHVRLTSQSPLMTPSDFLNPVVGGRVVVGPHTPTTSRPVSSASRDSSEASSSMSERQTVMEERMETLLETVRALSRQSSRHSEMLEPQSPASPPPSPDREDAYSDISEAEDENESESSDMTVGQCEREETMETEDELSEYEDEEVNEAVRNSVVTVGYTEEVPEAENTEPVEVVGRESANCVVAAGLEEFECEGAVGLENCVGVANPSPEREVEVSAVAENEVLMELEMDAMVEPCAVVSQSQEPMNKARAMLNILEPAGRGGNLPDFVGPFVRPVPWNTEPSRVIHMRSVIQRVYLPGGGMMETETVVKGPVVVDRACSP